MSGGATHWHRMIARGSRTEQPHLRSVRPRPGAAGDVGDALAPVLYCNLEAIGACESPSGAVKIAIRRAAQQFSILQKNVQLGE